MWNDISYNFCVVIYGLFLDVRVLKVCFILELDWIFFVFLLIMKVIYFCNEMCLFLWNIKWSICIIRLFILMFNFVFFMFYIGV